MHLLSHGERVYLSYMTSFGKIIVALVVSGGLLAVGYVVTSVPKNDGKVTEVTQENSTNEESEVSPSQKNEIPTNGKKMAFSEFIKQGGAYKCTVNQNVQNIETKGTVYISGDLVRGEFSTVVSGMNINSTFIVKDGYSYSWTSAAPTMGIKTKIVAQGNGGAKSDAGMSGSYSWNAEQIGDYNCEAWTLDQTKFTPPTTITFTSIN